MNLLRSDKQKKANRKFIDLLKRTKPKDLDERFHDLHEEVFAETDCLACANCCKTTSPIFEKRDIERIAPFLRLKVGDFIHQHLRIDEDEDYVLKTAPCAFLNQDNTCKIYEVRPRACREYPHTDRKNMAGILELTFRNTLVCPAVLKIVEKMQANYYTS